MSGVCDTSCSSDAALRSGREATARLRPEIVVQWRRFELDPRTLRSRDRTSYGRSDKMRGRTAAGRQRDGLGLTSLVGAARAVLAALLVAVFAAVPARAGTLTVTST